MQAIVPDNEKDRLAALSRYDLFDTGPEPAFDRLTRIAARAFSAPISLITLVGTDRQFFKSHHGISIEETPREQSFCAHAILSDEVMFVPDSILDPRFDDNPLVQMGPAIRSYLGAPLTTADGFRLGTICVIDSKPRPKPGAGMIELLEDLAAQVVDLMESRLQSQESEGRISAQVRQLESRQWEINRAQKSALQALAAAQMGYWERDADTDRISFSPVLEEMLGLDHERYDGSVEAWLEHVHPDDRAMIPAKIEDARRSGKNYMFKYRPLTSDGSERWITTTGTYRKDADGRFLGANGVSWDSTASEIAARQLKISEELFRALSDFAPIGIFRTDLGHNVLYANPALLAIHGVTSAELIGQGWLKYVHPDEKGALFTGITHATERGEANEYEQRIVLPDGITRWLRVKLIPVRDQNGQVVGKVGTADDITQQRKMVADLKNAKEAAEIANRAKDMFLANVSHELRTPLNGVLGMSELLVDAGLDESQLEMAEIVRESARVLLLVVNDMLDLSRIEAGRLAIENEPFNLRLTIEQTVSLLRAEAHNKGLSLAIVYPAEVPDLYIGDSGRVRQILTNYLANAIKFTSAGEIRIEVSQLSKDESNEVVLAVHDNGLGINELDQKKLFQPFSQVDGSTTRRKGGAGLGLAICKRLAELMHGTVGVNSTPGTGSVFWVRLPLIPCEDSSAAASSRRNRLLLVEDNLIKRRVALNALRSLGWETDVAESGLVALDLCKANHYSAVLMECNMPGMDGYATARRIRAWERSAGRPSVPIVALTSGAMPVREGQKSSESGISEYLVKPLALQRLHLALSQWVMPKCAGSL